MAKVKKVTTGTVKGKEQKAVELTDGTLVFQPNDDIEELLYNAYAEKFIAGKSNQKTWISQFVDKQMDSLKKSLKDDPLVALSAMREVNKTVKETKQYFESKKEFDTDFSRYLLRTMLFPWQTEFYDCPFKKITMLAGRRAGKSYAIVEKALKHCLQEPLRTENTVKPRQAMIIGLTLEKTAAIYWQNIKDALQKAHISTKHIDNGTYTVTFLNGNTLMLYGNNSKAEREKLRGKDLSFVAIDESQSQQALLYMVDTIIAPQLKGTNGEIVLAGTAPLSAGTYWEMAILSDEWFHFHATMEDNPSIPNHDRALDDVLAENHWEPDNIIFRREYLGELAYDTNILIYPFVTYYDALPQGFVPKKAYVGIDLGWTDKSAIECILIDANGNAYLVSEWSQSNATSTYMLEKCFALRNELTTKWKLPKEDIYFITDTNEQSMTRDWYNKGLYELSNIRKKTLEYSRALVNESLSNGTLKIKKGGPADIDHQKSVYKYDPDNNMIVYEEDKSVYHSDAMEAVRYAWQTYIEDESLAGGDISDN